MATTTGKPANGSTTQPAGWFVDPTDSRRHRYWDGQQWTSQVNDRELPPPVGDPLPIAAGTVHTPGPGVPPSAVSTQKKRSSQSIRDHHLPPSILSGLAILFGLVAVVFMPLYAGLVGVALAIGAIVRGERYARLSLKVAILGSIVGFALAYVSTKFGIGF